MASLRQGFDLLIDEAEAHFHKTLVENMLSLYMDKTVNRHGATLLFSTHYCEVLDLFNRQDNIWVCQSNDKVAIKNKITLVEKYCTKPELEMLLIISENLADEYEKVKSKTKAKIFAKANIRCGKRKYDNSTAFYEEYFGPNCEKLVDAIKAYRQHNGSHKKDEHYLAELLK